MINIQTVNFESKQSEDELFSKLKWQTYHIENPKFAKTNSLFLETNKSFAGKINTEKKEFSVTRIRSVFYFIIPQIFVNGCSIPDSKDNKLQLKFKLSFFTLLFALGFVYFTFTIIYEMIDKVVSSEEVLNMIITLSFVPICFIVGMYFELNKTKKEIYEVLGLS